MAASHALTPLAAAEAAGADERLSRPRYVGDQLDSPLGFPIERTPAAASPRLHLARAALRAADALRLLADDRRSVVEAILAGPAEVQAVRLAAALIPQLRRDAYVALRDVWAAQMVAGEVCPIMLQPIALLLHEPQAHEGPEHLSTWADELYLWTVRLAPELGRGTRSERPTDPAPAAEVTP